MSGDAVLVDFTAPGALDGWVAVHDVVMGGRSSGGLRATAEGAAFEGVVSLEAGGGFASVRLGPRPWPTALATAFVLRVRGDGRRYRLTARTRDDADGPQYQAAFIARPEWRDLVLRLPAFVARRRGRDVPDAPSLDPARIATLGLLVGGEQPGAFRLEIAGIHVRRA